MQEALGTAESNLTGLRKDMEAEQAQRTIAESSLQSSLEELEKIKAGFDDVHEHAPDVIVKLPYLEVLFSWKVPDKFHKHT